MTINAGRMKEYINDLDEQDDARDINEMTNDNTQAIVDSLKE